jgi:hypothetical protein
MGWRRRRGVRVNGLENDCGLEKGPDKKRSVCVLPMKSSCDSLAVCGSEVRLPQHRVTGCDACHHPPG